MDRAAAVCQASACQSNIGRKKRGKTAYVYVKEPTLKTCLDKELRSRSIGVIDEDESAETTRVCRICEVMAMADHAIIEVSEKDPDSFIVLGIAKAIQIKTLPVSLERYSAREFAWADKIESYTLDGMEHQLGKPLAKVLTFAESKHAVSGSE